MLSDRRCRYQFLRRRFAACVFACAASLGSTHAFAVVEAAKKADSLVDSIGINTHYINSAFTGQNAYSFTQLDQKLADLGIRHLRDNTAEDTTNPSGYPRLDGLYTNYGIRTTLVLGSTLNSPATLVNILKAHPAYEAIEGLNEPDFNARSYGGFTDNPATNDYSATRAYQNDINAAVKGDAQTAAVKVVSPAMGNTARAQYLSGTGFEFEAMHSYPNARVPSFNLDTRIANTNLMSSPPKPIWATETGYYNKTIDGGQVSETAGGKYTPRLFTEFFNRGIPRTYTYELVDENPTTDKESNFGLLHWDLTPKPAYTALKNLIDTVKEPSAPAFTPGSIDYTFSTTPTSIHHTLLEKSDGTFFMLVWNEISSWDLTNASDINNAPVPVTMNLATSFQQARVYLPGGTAQVFANPTSLNLSVPDQVVVVELSHVPEPTAIGATGVLFTLLMRRKRRVSPA
jgi:hypothetical protein